jgi:hypothetical protein
MNIDQESPSPLQFAWNLLYDGVKTKTNIIYSNLQLENTDQLNRSFYLPGVLQ